MYQDDEMNLMEEMTGSDEICDVIELAQHARDYNHRSFIISETRRARTATLFNPNSGNLIELVLWLDTLIYELDKDSAEESLKISA